MKIFKDIDEVEEWLAPMDYEGFWIAIEPYGLTLQPKDHCDQQIADGEVDQATVLEGIKYLARIELTQIQNLHWRMPTPWLKLVSSH
ncbi:hypothetical protein [Maritalea sp.]|jgi:hypothetical protein|uniref:hypothetical protein n=1 Tax=Maritalea sp. TaxID=2003361 RepID=UPI0039E4E097